MSLSWYQVYAATETTGDMTMRTTCWAATVTGGYLLRAERDFLYKAYLPAMPKSAMAFVAATAPTTVSLSEESSQSSTTTDPDDGDVTFTLTDKTYLLTPLDGGVSPIGTARLYLSTRLVRLVDNGLTASHDVSLAVVP